MKGEPSQERKRPIGCRVGLMVVVMAERGKDEAIWNRE